MVKGKTASGFEFSVNPNIVNDWRIAKAMRDLMHDEVKALDAAPYLVEQILGDQEDALCQHLAAEDGTVSTQEILNELFEIIKIVREEDATAKKS